MLQQSCRLLQHALILFDCTWNNMYVAFGYNWRTFQLDQIGSDRIGVHPPLIWLHADLFQRGHVTTTVRLYTLTCVNKILCASFLTQKHSDAAAPSLCNVRPFTALTLQHLSAKRNCTNLMIVSAANDKLQSAFYQRGLVLILLTQRRLWSALTLQLTASVSCCSLDAVSGFLPITAVRSQPATVQTLHSLAQKKVGAHCHISTRRLTLCRRTYSIKKIKDKLSLHVHWITCELIHKLASLYFVNLMLS